MDNNTKQFSAVCEEFVVSQTAGESEGTVPFFLTRIRRPVSPIIVFFRLQTRPAVEFTILAALSRKTPCFEGEGFCGAFAMPQS
jgi:hypothetical protein